MGINSKSKLREIAGDERAVAILAEHLGGEGIDLNNPDIGPVAGMRIKTLLKFPQTGLTKEQVDEICAKLDALDE